METKVTHQAMLACVHGQLVQMTLSTIYFIAGILAGDTLKLTITVL